MVKSEDRPKESNVRGNNSNGKRAEDELASDFLWLQVAHDAIYGMLNKLIQSADRTCQPKDLLFMRVLSASLSIAILAWGTLARAEEPTPPSQQHSLRRDRAYTGSNIKRVMVTWDVPLDKPYAALTPEQKALVRSQYEDMAEGDEPPFPLEGMAAFYKPLYTALERRPVVGLLSLHVQVNSLGEATAVAVLASPAAEVTKIAATLAMLVKYKPGLCGGTPCEMAIPLETQLDR